MKEVRGRVVGQLLGVCTHLKYDDGCVRPGSIDLEVGSLVISHVEIQDGICEHYDVRVLSTPKPMAPAKLAAASVAKPKPAQPKAITVEDILATREKPKRLPLPEADLPVDEATIAKAKIPPRLRSNPATAPVQNTAAIPIENQFEFDVAGLNPEEIAELRGGPSTEPISTGAPLNPFSQNFDPRNTAPQPGPQRKAGKPTSVFDLK